MKINEIKSKLKVLQKQIADTKNELKPLFTSGLEELFKKYENIDSIIMSINNHEFNDGDATYFSLYYDESTLKLKDGTEIEPGGENDTEETEAIREQIAKYFRDFDVDNFYESIYGDAYQSISFSLKNGKVISD